MKKLSLVFALAIVFSSQLVMAQHVKVNTEESSIEWVGKKITGEHAGTIQIKSGSFELDGDRIVKGNFVIDMTTITNTDIKDEGYSQKLVGHLNSDDFFGVETYPTAMFVVQKASKFSDGKAKIEGDITIKGKSESISFDVVLDGNAYVAQIEIDRTKFDIRYGSKSFFDNLGDKVIHDTFTLDVKLAVEKI